MTAGIFGLLLFALLVLFIKLGRPIAAVVLAFALGITLGGGALAAPVHAMLDGARLGVTAAANAMFSGGR